MKKNTKYIILLFLLVIPAIFSLLRSGFFSSHDGQWMVIRLSAFHQSLADGHFPVRWSQRLNHGFGYPVLNFLYPLPFYIAEIFYLFSSSLTLSIRLVFILSFFFSALFMYLFLKNRFKHWPSLAGALLYIYTPYRFVDTYVRGSIGESLGFVFVPLIFLSLDLLKKHPRRAFVLGSLSLALTILSHNVFIVFAVLALFYGFIFLPKKLYPKMIFMFILSACLSAYFWLPALLELKFTYASILEVANPIDHLVKLKQLIIPSWGFGPSNPRASNSMSFQLGIVNILVVICSIWLWFKQKNKHSLFFLLSFLFASFLMLSQSAFLWTSLSGISVIQFPWRLLSITVFASSFLASQISHLAKPIIILSILATVFYAHPSDYSHLPDSFYATNEDTTTVRAEYTPIWVKNPPVQRPVMAWEVIQGKAEVTDFTQTNISKTLNVKSDPDSLEPSTIKLASLYYPGWQIQVNGSKSPIKYSQYDGRIAFDVPPGESIVNIYWFETPLRNVANIISLTALLGLIIFSTTILITEYKKNH